MRILLAVEHYHPYIGGAEKLHQSVAEKLVQNGHRVCVVTTQFRPDLPSEETINGVEIKRIPLTNRFVFTFLGWLWMLAYARKSNLIQTASYNAALPAFLCGFFTQKPVVVTFHEVWGNLWAKLPYLKHWERSAFQLYEKMLLQLPFTQFIAVSGHTQKQLIAKGVNPKRVVKIYNGIDYSEFDGAEHVPPKNFEPLFFGRLGPSKGLDLLLPAWKVFAQESTNARLTVVIPRYPARHFKAIQNQIDQLDIRNSIVLKHELTKEQLYHQIKQASAVAIPSYAEGFCFAAVETSALGVPIISSNQGALKETVSGQVIHVQATSTSEWVNALKKAARGAYEWVPTQQFHLQDQAEQYIQLYKKLV